jgi:hypothetical protein
VFALGQDRSTWLGPASELRFTLQSADGSSLPLQGVNDIPAENSASLFNGYWGPELTLGGEGCFAVFAPSDQSPRVADYFACGALAGIPLAPGGYAIVARGTASEWLFAQMASPLAVAHSFPLGVVDFVVAGSHILMQAGAPASLTADKQNPRTVIGADANGFLYLLVIDGRSEHSLGMTLPELQAYVAAMGMQNAINLDGGGSSTLVVGGNVMNKPSDGRERPVASIVEVGAPRPACGIPFVSC